MIGYLALQAPWHWSRPGSENDPADDGEQSPYRLHGFPHPTVFKTVRNALRTAGPNGHVLLLDLDLLPLLEIETLLPADKAAVERSFLETYRSISRARVAMTRPGVDHLEPHTLEQQFQEAERQMLIWAKRCEDLRAELARRSLTGPSAGSCG